MLQFRSRSATQVIPADCVRANGGVCAGNKVHHAGAQFQRQFMLEREQPEHLLGMTAEVYAQQ